MKLTLRFGVVITSALWVAGVQAKPTEVTNVRIGVHAEKTRLVLEADAVFPYRVFLLANPYRVVIDLPNIFWRAPFQRLKTERRYRELPLRLVPPGEQPGGYRCDRAGRNRAPCGLGG